MTDSIISLPRRSLIALCGPAGAGKSTFAHDLIERNHLPETAIVSSDICRLMLCDDPRSVAREQWGILQPDTFRLFGTIIDMRMNMGRPVLADTVNLYFNTRPDMLGLARKHAYRSTLVVFDLSVKTCLSQNHQRPEHRRIPEPAIHQQRQLLDAALPHLAAEGWDHIVVLNEQRRTATIELDS
ncbi:MAG: AAA family ATPase [Dehalococcoidia bacterium]